MIGHLYKWLSNLFTTNVDPWEKQHLRTHHRHHHHHHPGSVDNHQHPRHNKFTCGLHLVWYSLKVTFSKMFSACCSQQLPRNVAFMAMITLTALLFLVEIIVGYVTNSMALVADSFHMLSDVIALLIGFVAMRLSKLRVRNKRFSFGWARAEVVGALVNAVFLLALCFSILVEALKRIAIPEKLSQPKLVLITGGAGLAVNIVGLFLFHDGHHHGHSHNHNHSHNNNNKNLRDDRDQNDDNVKNGDVVEKENRFSLRDDAAVMIDGFGKIPATPLLPSDKNKDGGDDRHLLDGTDKELMMEMTQDAEGNTKYAKTRASSLNIRGVFLHVLGDALGSVIVMISALIILYVKEDWTKFVDPTLSLILVCIILRTTFPLLKESALILMQKAPSHVSTQDIQERLLQCFPCVLGVHEFHVWQLTGNKVIVSLHLLFKDHKDYLVEASEIKKFFHDEGIHSTTIQPEFVESETPALQCLYQCNVMCSENTCCGNAEVNSEDTPLCGKEEGNLKVVIEKNF